ncbi:hypothetical protein ACFW1A_29480 [Kitasatospora sp. NPDC058965]|uniref:hypothetical protein n=1 Tax=Kitasatospora sp. NPDC058965 TaxID=3346682 RepID=UPI003688BC9C
MDDFAEQQHSAGAGHAQHQLAKAFVTAVSHPDEQTRDRAEQRIARWRAVLAGIAEGRLTVGSRTPVAGLPAWVTPEVVRGGFATSAAGAQGPLEPYEREAAAAAGLPADRAALFAHSLTESGLTRLFALLDSGRYELALPEEAALLTVAWLVRAGDVAGALALVEEVEPFAARLRFTPRPGDLPAPDPAAVHRQTAGAARERLRLRGPNAAVETQREALTVWQPFGDELLSHWLELTQGQQPDEAWLGRGAALLRRYRELAQAHTRCTKHRDPKQNLAVLRDALAETVAGRELDPRRAGLLRHAVGSMVRRRGLPGSAPHTALRARQAVQAALPSHHALAQLVLRRMSGERPERGITDVAPLVADVSAPEARETGLPEGASIPVAVRRVVEGALSAPPAVLVARGVVPSAEVLAELVPQLVAVTSAEAYPDRALRTLMAANYRAFRNRRSLLLLNLAGQVRVEELPWVRAVAAHRGGSDARGPARAVLRQLGELAVQAFPGTLLPNPLVRELGVLARQAELDAPLVEELAADIFMGTFGRKFLAAAQVAGELLAGSLYDRYYAAEYEYLVLLDPDKPADVAEFAALCTRRAGAGARGWSVAGNGKVIEQAQILTTHNLATLVARVGIGPAPGWDDLARRSFGTVCRAVALVHGNRRPLPVIKDAAYAWRQLVCYLSLCEPVVQARVIGELAGLAERQPRHVAARLAPVLTGLRSAAAGGSPQDGGGRQLLGWSTGPHWLAAEPVTEPVVGGR